MAISYYGGRHLPKIVRSLDGKHEERTTQKVFGIDSNAFYMGSFVSNVSGTDAAPTGVEGGMKVFADDNKIYGYAVGFYAANATSPIWEAGYAPAGTVTAPTGEQPFKYTFSANNDQVGTNPALELLEVMPMYNGDILEVALWGASTASVARGTTTAAGTTGSSANMGVGMSVNTTYTFALTESTAAVNLANLDFQVTMLDAKHPMDPNHVYARCLRTSNSFVVPE